MVKGENSGRKWAIIDANPAVYYSFGKLMTARIASNRITNFVFNFCGHLVGYMALGSNKDLNLSVLINRSLKEEFWFSK